MHTVKMVVGGVGGVVLAALFVAVNGILQMQLSFARGGAVVDVNGQVVGVSDPRVHWVALLGVVVFNALVLVAVTGLARRLSRGVSLVGVASFVAACAVALAWTITFRGPETVVRAISGGDTFYVGWERWLISASESTVVYVAPVLAVMGARVWRSREDTSEAVD